MKHQKASVLAVASGALLGIALLGPAAPACAIEIANPALAVDLSPGRIPDPLSPQNLTVRGNRLYFTGDTAETGREPWVSDGTDAGTRMLADLCPGPCSSSVAGFGEIAGKAVVVVQVGGSIRVMAEEDGELRTVTTLNGQTSIAFQLGGQVFFPFYESPRPDLIYGRTTLTATDGTAAGTVAGTTLCSGPVCGPHLRFSQFGEVVYFLSTNSHLGTAIHRLVAGPSVETIGAFGQFSPVNGLAAINDQRLVFRVAHVLDQHEEAWVYQTGVGTGMIDPPGPNAHVQKGEYFITWRGRLYYRNALGNAVSTNGDRGDLRPANELTGASPVVLAGTPSSLFYSTGDSLRAYRADGSTHVLLSGNLGFWILASWGERVLIRRGDSELWSSDGTVAGTVQLPALGAGSTHTAFDGASLGGVFYFAAGIFGTGSEHSGLWRTDGTAAGTFEIARGNSTRPASSGARPHTVGSKLIVDTALAGDDRKLWRVDPQTFAAEPVSASALVPLAGNGTVLLAQDLATGQLYAVRDSGPPVLLPASNVFQPPAGPKITVAPDGRFYFTDLSEGQELWESDGTAAGTRLLFDLDPAWISPCSPYGSCYGDLPGSITAAGDRVFFTARPAGEATTQLWVYDRITGERRKVPLPAGVSFQFDERSPLWAVGSRLAFAFPRNPLWLWQSDGVHEAELVLESEALLYDAVTVGDRLFLRVLENGEQLWVSDLTAKGTFKLETAIVMQDLTRVGDHVFYRFQTGEGTFLGWSDGTPAGTSSAQLPGPGWWSYEPEGYLAAGDRRLVLPVQTDEGGGKALFISDGTPAGLRRLGDAGGPNLDPQHFALWGNRLFFEGDDSTTGRELWAVDLPAESPGCPASQLCLHQDRFEVAVEVRTADGMVRQGQRALATSESGVFTFFGPDNWEFLVKVLDGCAVNDHYWVYAAAATDVAYTLRVLDRATGTLRTYGNPAGQAARPILDAGAFPSCSAEAPPPLHPPAAAPVPAAQRCGDDLSQLCLGDRFRVSAEWQTATQTGQAHAVANGSADSGLFSFFSASNWELMVKVLDGCHINGKHWIFAAGTTDVGWTLRVEDQATGQVKTYRNTLGNPSIAVTDIEALGGCGN